MIDDDVITAFEFTPADPHPTVIVELADRERLHRVSAVYKMAKGRLDVFLLQDLGTDPGELSGAKSVASVTDTDGDGKAALDFDTQGARYVALRWTPADNSAPHSFEVAEVSAAFDGMRASLLRSRQQLIESERLATIGRMASSISHDLRHSLASIVANGEFLCESHLNATQREELYSEILTAVTQMTEMIESLPRPRDKLSSDLRKARHNSRVPVEDRRLACPVSL